MAFVSASFNDKASMSAISAAAPQQNVVSSTEYCVKVPKTKKRFHALKFTIPNFKFDQNVKIEMARDATNQYVPKYDWEAIPKSGQGSEFNRENREIAKRKKHGYVSKKISPDDMPWVVTVKGNDKDKAKDKQYIGKKSISENSCYFVFVKCPDGGFEAHPLEDWYSFTAHKAYKTLNIEEAEEEFKRRHKILNKYLIMANKRKNEGEEDEGDEDDPKSFGGSKGIKFSKMDIKSDDEDDGSDDGKRKKKSYKSSNLSDDDEEDEKNNEDEDGSDMESKKTKKSKKAAVGKNSKRKIKKKNSDDEDDDMKNKEDSDDGDAEGLEKDYSSTSESSFESEEEKNEEEKYEEKGIDEEEPIKALDKSTDEEGESEEDEGLTEEGKEYRKLMSKEGLSKEEAKDDNFDEFIRTGKLNDGGNDEDSKDSNLTSDSEFDDDVVEKKSKSKAYQESSSASKLKRKATDDLANAKLLKKQSKNSASAPNMVSGLHHQDESSSSSTTSGAANNGSNKVLSNASKSSKTAAALAAASKSLNQSGSTATAASVASMNTSTGASSGRSDSNNPISESDVRKYLERKPMTTRELYQKFRNKTQGTLSKEDLLKYLTAVLDKLDTKIIVINGDKYLELKNK